MGRIYGIIPAYAGNTEVTIKRFTPLRDHPRVCGEHDSTMIGIVKVVGSSPRMRGTPHVQLDIELGGGIIPAYAGNTYKSLLFLPVPWDHPRVCGEHSDLAIITE